MSLLWYVRLKWVTINTEQKNDYVSSDSVTEKQKSWTWAVAPAILGFHRSLITINNGSFLMILGPHTSEKKKKKKKKTYGRKYLLVNFYISKLTFVSSAHLEDHINWVTTFSTRLHNLCAQRRFKPACASAQSEHSLCRDSVPKCL